MIPSLYHYDHAVESHTTTDAYVALRTIDITKNGGTIVVKNTGATNSADIQFKGKSPTTEYIIPYLGNDESAIAGGAGGTGEILPLHISRDTGIQQVIVYGKATTPGSQTTVSTEACINKE